MQQLFQNVVKYNNMYMCAITKSNNNVMLFEFK